MDHERKKKLRLLVFLVFLLIVYDLGMVLFFYFWFAHQIAQSYSTDGIVISGNHLSLDSLTLRQKLSQMIIVSGRWNGPEITRMNVGGIYLFGNWDKEDYVRKIQDFDNASRIPLFISTDLEGYWNPFQRFYNSSFVYAFHTPVEARKLGEEHGKILKEIGFTVDFSPVAEANGKVWDGRGFNGSAFEVAQKAQAYVEGLESYGILSVAKHYPGGSIDTLDPHQYVVIRNITGADVFPFSSLLDAHVSGIMVGHVVASGEINSGGKPCSVSPTCVQSIRENGYRGLIFSDEVNMKGLTHFYPSKEDLYVDLLKAGNDVILDFSLTPRSLDALLRGLEKRVQRGDIDEGKIDNSVRRILGKKRYVVG